MSLLVNFIRLKLKLKRSCPCSGSRVSCLLWIAQRLLDEGALSWSLGSFSSCYPAQSLSIMLRFQAQTCFFSLKLQFRSRAQVSGCAVKAQLKLQLKIRKLWHDALVTGAQLRTVRSRCVQ